MILFKDIYNKSVNLFDDPEINKAYVENKVRFEKLMYPFLIEGLSWFSNPTNIVWELMDKESPNGKMEIFSYDEVSGGKVTLSTQPAENSDFVVMVNGKIDFGAEVSVQNDGKYVVTISSEINPGDEISVEWYFCGQFNTDFSKQATSKISSKVITEKVKEILSHALVLAWADQEHNYLLDIKNILRDTDFTLSSPANSVRAKSEWFNKIQYNFDTLQNKFAWDLYSAKWDGGRYYE